MTINNLGIFRMNWDFRMLVFEDLKLGVTFEGKVSWSKRKDQKKPQPMYGAAPDIQTQVIFSLGELT